MTIIYIYLKSFAWCGFNFVTSRWHRTSQRLPHRLDCVKKLKNVVMGSVKRAKHWQGALQYSSTKGSIERSDKVENG
jgi:hypothetical protein